MENGAIRQVVKAAVAVATLGVVAAAAQPAVDLSGTWSSNIGLTYTITHAGPQITWTASNGGQGTLALTSTGLTTSWTDSAGPHTATGTIVERDTNNQPTKIAWSNGVVFERRAAVLAQAATAQALRMGTIVPQGSTATTSAGTPPPLLGSARAKAIPDASTIARLSGMPDGFDLYLTISGLPTAPGQVFIPVRRVVLDAKGGEDGVVGSARAARTSFAFTIVKDIDAATPSLMRATADGTRFPEAILQLFDRNLHQLLAAWALEDVAIASYRLTAGQEGAAPHQMEEVCLSFKRILVSVCALDPKSMCLGWSESGFDISR